MSEAGDERGATRAGLTLAFFALIASLALGVKAFFAAPWFVWVSGLIFLGLASLAALGLSDPASRNFLAGTLRHRTYTQIYRTLVGRRHARLWAALCEPVDDNASLPVTFRAALTWRLYDRALLLAVAYPIVLPVLWWLASGQAAQLGPSVFLAATDGWRDVWPERAAASGAIVILTAGFVGRELAIVNPRRFWRSVADWLPPFAVAFAGAVAIAGTVAVAVAVASAGAVAVAVAFAFAGAVAFAGSVAVAVAVAFAAAFAYAGAGAVAFALAVAVAVSFAVAVAVAGAVAFAVAWPNRRKKSRLARWIASLWVLLGWLLMAALVSWEATDDLKRSIFIFLGIFPLVHALFDVVSYAVTLALIHRGLRAPRPFWNGLADLVLALVLFLGLGVTLVAVISILNAIAGTDILDVIALLADVRAEPHAYWWLYAMVFSTILPTALHGLLAALGVQGIWPRALRRPVADWVDSADRTQLHNLRAAFALGLLWAVPVCVLILLGWGLWHVGGDAARAFAEWYLSVLDRTAAFFFVGEVP